MKKMIILSIAAVFLMTGTGFSKMRGAGDSDNFKMPHGKWWKIPAVKEELKITDAEQNQLDALYAESRRKMIDLKAAVEKAQLELEIILDGKDFNKKAAMKQFQTLESAKATLAKERFAFIVEARELFGQERFAKICTKRKAFMKRGYHNTEATCPVSGSKTAGKAPKGCPRINTPPTAE